MLPQKYSWLTQIGTLPKLVSAAIQLLGIKEYPGLKNNNQVIMNMAKEIGAGEIYKNDEMSWCAVLMFYLLKICGKPFPPLKDPTYDLVRAESFINYGEPVEKGQERLGDIGVFNRPGGHHVALIIAQSEKTFHILGGNQSNMVCFIEISKDRLQEARRFYLVGAPESAKKPLPFIDSSGKLSVNES